MKTYQCTLNCLLAMAVIACIMCACASSSTVKPEPVEQPVPEENIMLEQEKGATIIKSLALVDQFDSCTLSFLTGAAPQYTIFKLSEPHRIIVDLPEFSIDEHIDLEVGQNDYVSSISSEKIQDKDRDYLRLTIILQDDFAYSAVSDATSLNIDIGNSKAPAVKPEQSQVAEHQVQNIPVLRGPMVVSAIVPHTGQDGTSIEIASDAAFGKYQAYILKKPNRLVIDMPGAKTEVNEKAIAVNSEYINQVRIGASPEKLRVVLDIASADMPQYQIVKQGKSLLVHLQGEKGGAIESGLASEEHVAQPAEAEEQQDVTTDTVAEFDEIESEPKNFNGPNISFDFKDADIKNVLRLIADISGKNMIISDSVGGRVTLKLDDIPLDEALELVLETNGLGSIVSKNIIRIETRERIKLINEEKLLARKSHEEVVELEIKTFDISYTKASDMAAFIKSLMVLSDRGTATAFKLTNKLTVKDIPENIPRIARLIREQDVPTRQVMIEARVVQSNPSYTKELGIRWGGSYRTTKDGNPISIGGQGGTGSVVDLPAAAGAGSGGLINLGYIRDNLTLDMQLSALENDDKIKIVSNPRVIGLDNQEARIKQGVALPYLTLNDNGVTSTEFKDAVLELEVTPKITPSNTVSLEVKVTKNQKSAQTGTGNEPGIDIREVETYLLIQSGVTAVIGGIYETTKTVNVKRVPYFGTLPYIGYFFKNTKYEEQLTELLIFLTVTVLDAPENLTAEEESVAG